MRISSVWMKNTKKGIEISEISLGKINLFVGSSGVGKTQILRSIYNLKKIIKEDTESLAGLQWKINFLSEGNRYSWEGGFSIDKVSDAGRPFIEQECFRINDELVFSRQENDVSYRGMKLPKISADKSVLSIFPEEEEIKGAVGALMQIYYTADMAKSRKTVPESWIKEHISSIKSEDELINSDYDLINKLALAFELEYDISREIKEEYTDIFPQVEDVKIAVNEETRMYYLSIKEKSSGWLEQNAISAGMYKTLLFIAEMKLLKSQSVLLIDEIENSLGVNCMDIVADLILLNEKEMQFLITSHHPYIINNIDVQNWHVVMREGSCIFTKTAQQLNLGKSRHEFFKQLLNSKEYIDGIS